MDSTYRKGHSVLLLGDLLFFVVSLWLALFLRNLEAPSLELISLHLAPFSFLFAVWILVFYIAGLYEKHINIIKTSLSGIVVSAQLVNSGIAVVFFYYIPFFGITPKTTLFIYLFVSLTLILFWRMQGYFLVSKGRPENAILIGSGDEMKDLLLEVNSNPIYNLKFIFSVDLARADRKGFWDELTSRIYSENVSIIAIDLADKNTEPVLPHLYNLMFSKINFIDMHKIYEDIFNRVPLSLLKYDWFLENISTRPRIGYDFLKHIMDIVVSLALFVISLIFYPFVWLAIKLDDGGPIFISQERIGQGNRVIHLKKFRSMERNDVDLRSATHTENKVTRVGKFLRNTRIDELPQLWSVLSGDLSLIGPRPELPSGVEHYKKEIPYYNVRHLIKPGLSGWAQIYHDEHPHHGLDIVETKNKLAYDLYYIKNRSFLLDLKIALRTVRSLVSMAGR